MGFAFGRLFAEVAMAVAVCGTCDVSLAFAGQGQGGPPGRGPGAPFGSGGSIVRVGPGALRPDPSLSGKAREPSSLRDALFGSHGTQRAAVTGLAPGRYVADPGRGFVFEPQTREVALIKFEDSPEIWALTAAAGPRGDLIFRNDVGDPILRATRMGGVTLFTASRPEGQAAAQIGAAPSLRPPPTIGPQALIQALAQASSRASRAAQHLVAFEAPDVTASTDWVFADAAWVASEGFVRAASAGAGARTLVTRVLAVRFTSGRAPDVAAQGQVLQITVAPDRGPAGRPSSQRIAMTLTRR